MGCIASKREKVNKSSKLLPSLQNESRSVSMDVLPPELCHEVAKYLEDDDLRTMRIVNEFWNRTAKTLLRMRRAMDIKIDSLETLIRFNTIFSRFEPREGLALLKFTIKLPAFDSPLASEHWNTFVQLFGHLVTLLTLDLSAAPEWYATDKVEVVLGHVTLLLDKVRGQLEELEVIQYAGLFRPTVLGTAPFPALTTLTLRSFRYDSTTDRSEDVAQDEKSIQALSSRLPAIQRFKFHRYYGPNGGDNPLFLPIVLIMLTRANPRVKVTLSLQCQDAAADSLLLPSLTNAPSCVVFMALKVDTSDNPESLRRILTMIGGQTDRLKRLFFEDEGEASHQDADRTGLKFPSLKALESLMYSQRSEVSLLHYGSADYFPKLNGVFCCCSGNDYTVALPTVTEAVLLQTEKTGLVPRHRGGYGQYLFPLPPFPNLRKLMATTKFLNLSSIMTLQNLSSIEVDIPYPPFQPDISASKKPHTFWKKLTGGLERMTLEAIRAIPEPAEAEMVHHCGPQLCDITKLSEMKVFLENNNDLALGKLNTLLFISKTKRLQRLQKLILQRMGDDEPEIPAFYLKEFRRFHNSVVVINEKKIMNLDW